MAVFLLYADTLNERNSNGINAVLVDAADEAGARSTAKAKAPTGEVQNIDNWAAIELAGTAGAAFPGEGYIFFQGAPVSPLQRHRGQ